MTLFENTVRAAATERARRLAGANLLTRDGATLETNPMGIMRWYLHPDLDGPSTRSLYCHELEIPVGSRTGRLQCQGGTLHYVLEGSGCTDLDGVRHEWCAGDVIAIPIKESGVTYQHLNTGDDVVRMLVVNPNLDSALGPEAGVELKVLEESPDFTAQRA
ncbi:MAG TPA: cupin domain-containing protein [Acidothermaceae bacterium]|jgi:gentisate 1,2-dioxygenase